MLHKMKTYENKKKKKEERVMMLKRTRMLWGGVVLRENEFKQSTKSVHYILCDSLKRHARAEELCFH